LDDVLVSGSRLGTKVSVARKRYLKGVAVRVAMTSGFGLGSQVNAKIEKIPSSEMALIRRGTRNDLF
jgi:hypothetical protein